MTQWTVTLPGEEDTVAFGRRLGRTLLAEYAGTGLVYLIGELGAGKTTLARGVLQALGHSGVVKSPTYTLLEPYRIGAQDAFHFDLYRVNDPEELSFIGFDEIIDGPGLKLIEWPERATGWLPEPTVEVTLHVTKPDKSTQQEPGREASVLFHQV